MIRTLDNALNGFIPKLSADIPDSSQQHDLQQTLHQEQQFSDDNDTSDFTDAERAFFMTLVMADHTKNLASSQQMVSDFKLYKDNKTINIIMYTGQMF